VNSEYPSAAAARDQWILSRRGPRNTLDPRRPYACLIEQERAESGEVVPVATVFLTNRECPWRCLMCDLWKNTLTETLPVGAIPEQMDFALRGFGARTVFPARGSDAGARGKSDPRSGVPQQIKLYNSGSFFDPRAIPPEDYPAIAEQLRGFERVIVECHPALVGESAVVFRDRLGSTKLEVAMGLETAHPDVLEKLNKRMTLDQFSRAASFLREQEIALRIFVLVKPPFLGEAEALVWANRSVDFAFDCGATVVSLIPTRPGNGALEEIARGNEFSPPKLVTLETALDVGVGLGRGRVFADLWDLERFSACRSCFTERRERLQKVNLLQIVLPPVRCGHCQTD
jgi:radical SAM enzyme (TIGR01210 family)